MLNQLPKKLNQSNYNPLTSYNNEKHLNLLDSINTFQKSQEERVINFIFVLSIVLGLATSLITYLNLTRTDKFSLDPDSQINIDYLKSKESTFLDLKEKTDFLKRYKEVKDSIKIKQSIFFSEIKEFINFIGNISIESIQYVSNENNIYLVKISFYSKDPLIQDKIKQFESESKKFKKINIESVEKISESNETKYVISGEIDGR